MIKEKKIKLNKNNIKNYLEIEDLWNKDFYKKNDFYQELKKLKNLGIKIDNMIRFYEKCCNNMYKNYFEDVKTELKNIKEDIKRIEKGKEIKKKPKKRKLKKMMVVTIMKMIMVILILIREMMKKLMMIWIYIKKSK